jgi:hypothetical protein
MKGLSMPCRTARSLSLIVVSIAVGVVSATPAHAFTPPIGSDKGSITAAPAPDGSTRVIVAKYYDMSSPY